LRPIADSTIGKVALLGLPKPEWSWIYLTILTATLLPVRAIPCVHLSRIKNPHIILSYYNDFIYGDKTCYLFILVVVKLCYLETNGLKLKGMIENKNLTPEQIERFPEFVEKWSQIWLSTTPADRPKEPLVKLAWIGRFIIKEKDKVGVRVLLEYYQD